MRVFLQHSWIKSGHVYQLSYVISLEKMTQAESPFLLPAAACYSCYIAVSLLSAEFTFVHPNIQMYSYKMS